MANWRKGRPLTPEDQEMWKRVTQTVRPSHPLPKDPPDKQSKTVPATKKSAPKAVSPNPSSQARKTPDAISAAQLDGKLDSRLKRGRIEPQRTLDLHGLTAARAEAILKLFVSQARREGLRLVLVITGKGRTVEDHSDIMPRRKGVLRDHLPIWVSHLGDAVVKTVPAHQRHGGAGAFYLYLRRKRGDR